MSWFFRVVATVLIIIAVIFPFYQQGLIENYSESDTSLPVALPDVYIGSAGTTTNLPDFASFADVLERKRSFFAYLLPAIHEENRRIEEQRKQLLRLQNKIKDGEVLNSQEKAWLKQMSEFYRVESSSRTEQLASLLRRADIVPDTLILIQAANESGWGTSRFATDALNFFGQWCWSPGCGLVPTARPAGQVYEVRTFESMEESVRGYIRNLNTHFAYAELRSIRANLRTKGLEVTAVPLTAGLLSYSERGEDYIRELNQMIRVNRPIIREVQQDDSIF